MIDAERFAQVTRVLTPWSAPDDFAEPERAVANRVIRAGALVAVVGVILQTAIHTANAVITDDMYWSVNAENNPIAWSHGVAIFAAAFVSAVRALLIEAQRAVYVPIAVVLAFMSLDEIVFVHERIVSHFLEWFDLSDTWDSVLWPIIYLPLGAFLAYQLIRAARTMPHIASRLIVLALVLLVGAVGLEVVSAPWSDEDGGMVHTIEGAFEEAAELMAWVLLATALTASTLASVIRSTISPGTIRAD